MSAFSLSEPRPWRVALIGSGPAAFYAAEGLLKAGDVPLEIEMLERLPTPYGLVRGGVAPDHQSVKAVSKIYERTAQRPGFRFWGNLTFGKEISHADLKAHFDAIIYAVGAQSDRSMRIPGEDLQGSHSATEFVGWYNGHPDYRHLHFNLTAERVGIIGMGNVAVDVARILAKTPEELAKTDIADYALEALRHSCVKEIFLIARRGPAQAAFTNVEARELLLLENAQAWVNPAELELDGLSQHHLKEAHERTALHNLEIMHMMAKKPLGSKPRTIHLRFLRSPLEVLGDSGKVQKLVLGCNQIIADAQGGLQAKPTGLQETLELDLLFRSIGYKGVPLPGVPFDPQAGTIPNQAGRVWDTERQAAVTGEYVVGWAKRGPSGVIGTNKPDALETVHRVLEDFAKTTPLVDAHKTAEAWANLLKTRGIRVVTFEDWKFLDRYEIAEGIKQGKPREKLSEVAKMLEVIESQRSFG